MKLVCFLELLCNNPPPMTQYCPLLAPHIRLPRRSPILELLSQRLAKLRSSYRFMTITALKRVVSYRVHYTYKHILIPRRCETSQSPPLWTQRPCWRPSWDHPILGIPASARRQPFWACARSHHLRLGNGSDTISNNPPPMTQYCPLLAPHIRLPRRSPILELLSQRLA